MLDLHHNYAMSNFWWQIIIMILCLLLNPYAFILFVLTLCLYQQFVAYLVAVLQVCIGMKEFLNIFLIYK